MAFLDSIRLKFYQLNLQKELKKRKQMERSSMSFDKAKNIGILFSKEQEETILKYVHQLRSKQNKKVVLLGFYPPSNTKEPLAYPFDVYTIKDVNWKYCPKSAVAKSFMEQPFDFLINFMEQHTKHSDYIMTLSKAKFRIGTNSDNTDAYDLILDGAVDSPQKIIKILEKYLKIFD